MRKFKIFLCGIFIFTLVGCGKDEVSGYKDVQEALMNMESYTCSANVKYISNQGENEYNILQKVKKDGKYTLETTSPKEVQGSKIIYDGKLIWQYNPQVEQKISVADKEKIERKEINIFTFLENHIKSQDIAVQTSSTDEGIYTILEAKIPGNNKYFSSEKLWLNNDTKLPEKLIVYDEENKERVIVIYDDFVYNPKLEDSIFNVETIEKE